MTRDTSKRLTLGQFNKAKKAVLKRSENACGKKPAAQSSEIAKLALVDGKTRVEIATMYNVTRQYIDKVANQYYDAYMLDVEGYPASWRTHVVHGSPALIRKIKELEKAEKTALKDIKHQGRQNKVI